MRRIVLLAGLALTLGACGSKERQLMTPGTRLIYHGGESGHGVYTMCDRGNRVYFTERGLMQVVPGGCPTGDP